MANVDQRRKEEHGGLSVARTEFASSLARRLEAIQSAITAFEQQAHSSARRDNLIRRLHALGASAKVLGFAAAAESLSRAEQHLRTGLVETLADDLKVVRSQLATLPTLVLRGTYSMLPAPTSSAPDHATSPSPLAQGPWCVLVCGSVTLADTLRAVGSASSGFELIHTQELSRLREMCAMYGPDVVVLDASSLNQIEELLHTLRDAPETAGANLVAAQAEEGAALRLQQAGAHSVLTSSVSPVALWRAINRTRTEDYDLPPTREPLGDVALRDLCDRVSREIRRGLLEATDADAQASVIPLGEGTEIRAAIWAAVARIREIVVTQSEGRVHFGPGPEGGIVLSAGAGPGSRGRTLADSASIDLTGRRIVVADDDPAVAWFVAGTLRAVGADVREVQDGRRALNLVYQWWPELVVSDVLMPGMDGFALCREIKRDVVLRDVPVILLSWKEDLLFRLRELGADADGYLRKEASASALVNRVRELLWPRISLERRLRGGLEVRGRLDGITPRSLIDAACRLERSLRILLRDASAHYDIRIRDHSLRAIARTRLNGSVERGQAALALLLGVSAGRFSVVGDDQPIDDDFAESDLNEVLRAPILRARAAQRVLSGSALGMVERVTLDPETFADELSMLPLSLRPLVDELLRGTPPRQLLASGTASLRSLESLLSDAARRGAVRAIAGPSGEDLLTREILALSAPSSEPPPGELPGPPAMFTFQLSPSPPTAALVGEKSDIQIAGNSTAGTTVGDDGFDWTAEANWELDIPPESDSSVRAERSSPFSRPRLSAEWGTEKRTSPGAGVEGSVRKRTPTGQEAILRTAQGPDAAPSPIIGQALTEPKQSINETPELSQVVAAAISKEPALPAQLRPVVTPPRPAQVVEVKEQPAVLGQPHATVVSSSTDEEAIFPLFPSCAPDKRSQRNTPQPAPAAVVLPPSTTLSSELAPRVEITAEPPNSPVPSGSSDSSSNDVVVQATVSEVSQSPSVSERFEIHERAEDATPNQAESPNLQPIPVHRTNSWMVPLGLAISTGFLAFAVTWPIVRQFNSRPVASPASSASTLDLSEAGSMTYSASSSTGTAAPSAVGPKETIVAPPGVVIPPDKGLVVIKTGGVHSIFVDDEFIGRGPERVVTLDPGQHRVRVSLNGEEHTECVDAAIGRVVELSLEQSGQ